MLGSSQSALDVIGETYMTPVDTIAVPAGRFDPQFFVLRSGLAGEFVQKFVNYRKRLVVLGDIAAELAASDALQDWVRESNRGDALWFLPDLDALGARLAP